MEYFLAEGAGVFITGASGGLGVEMAKVFQENGCQVFGTSTSAKGLEKFLYGCNGTFGAVCDSRFEDQVAAAAKLALEQLGHVDVLINNIGIASLDSIFEMTLERFNDVMNVNAGSQFVFTKHLAPSMEKAGKGRIVNINSIAGLQPYGNAPTYAASKYAMTGFAKSLRHLLHQKNIQVINIYPGGIDTDFHSFRRPEFMNPRDVAEAVFFAANSPWNAYVSDLTIVPSRDFRLP